MNRKFNLGFDRYSGIYLFAAFVVLFGIWSPQTFLTMDTVHLVASEQAAGGMVALALLIPMIAGQFDLSVGAMANLGGLIAVVMQLKHGWAPIPALLFAVVVGVVVGLVNGFIVVRLGVNSFIATLGMSSVLVAVQTIITGGSTPPPVTSTFWNNMTQHQIFGFQIIVLYLIVLAILLWWVLGHTPFGRYLYATGSNVEAARLSGIRTGLWSWTSLVLSAAISALAGCFYVSLTGPDLTFGSTLLLPSFAAVFLGSTQLLPGKFNVWGTLLAIVVLATGAQGLQLVTGVQWIQDMFNGVALILAVALSVRRRRAAGRGTMSWLRMRKPPEVEAAGVHTADHLVSEPPVVEQSSSASGAGP
jgi:ribose transport system permease protein